MPKPKKLYICEYSQCSKTYIRWAYHPKLYFRSWMISTIWVRKKLFFPNCFISFKKILTSEYMSIVNMLIPLQHQSVEHTIPNCILDQGWYPQFELEKKLFFSTVLFHQMKYWVLSTWENVSIVNTLNAVML